MSEKVWTPEELADYLNVHPMTVLKMIKDKKLKAIKIGRMYRIMQKDFEDFLEKARV